MKIGLKGFNIDALKNAQNATAACESEVEHVLACSRITIHMTAMLFFHQHARFPWSRGSLVSTERAKPGDLQMALDGTEIL